jgi:hypothetical protein
VPKKVFLKALEKKSVHMTYIRAIQDINNGVTTSVSTPSGASFYLFFFFYKHPSGTFKDFHIRIGLHQNSKEYP